MNENLVNIGFKNSISTNKLLVIVKPNSTPTRRLISEARDRGMLIDTTYGRRTRAVIITDTDHVILSSVQPETIAYRFPTTEKLEEVEESTEVF
jgi:extracellular matrix regulatory protein A